MPRQVCPKLQNSIMRYTILIIVLCAFAIGPVSAQQDSTLSQALWQPDNPVERMPSFPGGAEAMYRFIYSEMRYPAEARKSKITGQVYTRFVINAEGKMENIIVVRKLGYGCDEEALRILNVMRKNYTWDSGLHNGKAVPVTFTLPLKFSFQ